MKHCKLCNKDKPLSEFHSDRSKRDGRMSTCKQCQQYRKQLSYSANKGVKRVKRKDKNEQGDIVTRSCMCCQAKFETDQSYRLCSRCRSGDKAQGYDYAYFCEAA